MRAADQALSGGIGTVRFQLLGGDRAPREVQAQISIHGDRLLAVLIDITPRGRAEAQLEEPRVSQAAAALALTEAIPVGTYTMVMEPDRPVAYFSFMSQRFLDLIGIDRARAQENPLEASPASIPTTTTSGCGAMLKRLQAALPSKASARWW